MVGHKTSENTVVFAQQVMLTMKMIEPGSHLGRLLQALSGGHRRFCAYWLSRSMRSWWAVIVR